MCERFVTQTTASPDLLTSRSPRESFRVRAFRPPDQPREPSGRRQCCRRSFGRPCDLVHMRGAQTHLSIAPSAPNHWGGEWEVANDRHHKSSLARFSRNIAGIRNSQAARAVLQRGVIGITHAADLRPGSERWFFLVAWARQSRHSIRPPMGWRLMTSSSAISSGYRWARQRQKLERRE